MATSRRDPTAPTRGRTPNTSSQHTKDALVAAATAVLAERGYAGASTRTIAARAECNQALIFYHFGSIDDLLLTVLDTVSTRRMATLGAKIEQAQSLSALLDVFEQMVTEDVRDGDLAVLVALIAAGRDNPQFADAVGQRLEPWQQLTENTIRRFASRNPLGLLVPAPAVARTLMATALGIELLRIPTSQNAAADTDFIGQLRVLAAAADNVLMSGGDQE